MAMAPLLTTNASTNHHAHHLLLTILLLLSLTPHHSVCQPPPQSSQHTDQNDLHIGSAVLSPSMVIVIVLLVSAFLFLSIFGVYIRHCNTTSTNTAVASLASCGPPRGLAAEVITSFPIVVYAELEDNRKLKDYVECAICLADFEEDEKLRLLPHCSHVFHQDCIDAWLSGHVTCPVCRSDLAGGAACDVEAGSAALPPVSERTERPQLMDSVVIDVGSETADLTASWRRTIARFKRSHSTGHSVSRPRERLERYELRLPEHVRREIFDVRRSSSGDESAGDEEGRRGYWWLSGGGAGDLGGGRSVRMVRSERWPAFFVGTLSAKREGMARETIAALILPFHCLRLGGGSHGGETGIVDFCGLDFERASNTVLTHDSFF